MPKDKHWVLYKEIKETVTMEMVLDHYGLLEKLKRSGKNLVGCCPIHKGTNPNQFSVSIERNLFNCFGDCQAGGNILDLVSRLEGISTRESAFRLHKWFLEGSYRGEGSKYPKSSKKLVREENKEAVPETKENKPLSFELKNLSADHPFFEEQGIAPETVNHFGLGYCTKGIMKGRIAIPIHNSTGQLVAYCGRAVTTEQGREEGKYKMPPGFFKTLEAYNLHRQDEAEKLFILVESYLSVWKLHQEGYNNVLALMGSALSPEQEKLIGKALDPNGEIILLFDADEDGRKCTEECLNRLSRSLFVKAIDISPYGKKPHHLSPQQISELLK